MRPIDADAISYVMLYKENWVKGTGREEQGVWKSDIDKMPTIDAEPNSCKYWDSERHFCAHCRSQAEPVRRGRWVEEPGMFMCSVCYDPWGTENEEMIKEFNYCPNCGAKMEGTNETD